MSIASEETLRELLRAGAVPDTLGQTAKGAIAPAQKFTLLGAAASLATIDVAFLGTGTEYVQIHDSTGVIASATLQGFGYPITAGAPILVREFPVWRKCTSGIVVALSTTRDTYTASIQTMIVFGQWVAAP
jgi:hypothetical protein